MSNLPVPDYEGLDVTSKLQIHVPLDHELPFAGVVEIKNDSELFLEKKKEAFNFVNDLEEKKTSKKWRTIPQN